MRVFDVHWVLEEELVDDHLYRFKLRSHDIYLRTCVTTWEDWALKFDRVGEDVVFLDTASLWYWVKKVEDGRIERFLDNKVTRLSQHLKVLEEAFTEKVVNYVKAVRFLSVRIISRSSTACTSCSW